MSRGDLGGPLMFQADHKSPWTVIGVFSWGNFFYCITYYYQIDHVLQPPKVVDVVDKGHLEFILASVPTFIGSDPKWPSNRVARISLA